MNILTDKWLKHHYKRPIDAAQFSRLCCFAQNGQIFLRDVGFNHQASIKNAVAIMNSLFTINQPHTYKKMPRST